VAVRGGSPAPHAVVRHLLATPRSRAASAARAHVATTALRLTGLEGVADRDPATLTVGEQRLLQVARAVGTGAGVLLLDEPAAGMTPDERARLRGVLRALAGNGCAVLLVEHDMALVAAVADRVTVLAAGRVLSSGTPEQVRADPAVRSAYLGAPREDPHEQAHPAGRGRGGRGRAAPAGVLARRCGGRDEVLFVVSAPLTESPWIGGFVQRGAELAVAELNESGGIGGRTARLEVLDNAGSPQRAADNARTAVAKGAAALITDGVGAVAVSEVTDPAPLPVFVVFEGGASIVDPAERPTLFRLAPANRPMSQRLADYVSEQAAVRRAAGRRLVVRPRGGRGDARQPGPQRHHGDLRRDDPRRRRDVAPQVLEARRSGAQALIVWARASGVAAVVRAARSAAGTCRSSPARPVRTRSCASGWPTARVARRADVRVLPHHQRGRARAVRGLPRGLRGALRRREVGVEAGGRPVLMPPDWSTYSYDAVKLTAAALGVSGGRLGAPAHGGPRHHRHHRRERRRARLRPDRPGGREPRRHVLRPLRRPALRPRRRRPALDRPAARPAIGFDHVRPLRLEPGRRRPGGALRRAGAAEEELAPSYNVAPTDPVPVVLERSGTRLTEGGALGAGAVVGEGREGRGAAHQRAQRDARDKPAFRAAYARRACLVPADGYYEWKQDGDRKQPYYLSARDGGPLAMAGLYEVWSRRVRHAAERLWTCTSSPPRARRARRDPRPHAAARAARRLGPLARPRARGPRPGLLVPGSPACSTPGRSRRGRQRPQRRARAGGPVRDEPAGTRPQLF
jgi:hypothetical protein